MAIQKNKKNMLFFLVVGILPFFKKNIKNEIKSIKKDRYIIGIITKKFEGGYFFIHFIPKNLPKISILKTKRQLKIGEKITIKKYTLLEQSRESPSRINQYHNNLIVVSNKIEKNSFLFLNFFKYIYEKIDEKKREIYEISKKVLTPDSKVLFLGIFCGETIQEKHEILELFKKWGILHYLARSGLHIQMIRTIFSYPLYYFFVLQRTVSSLILLLLFLLVILSTPSISFQRSIITFTINFVLLLKKIPIDPLITTSATALLLLIYNHLLIYQISFQLTFIATIILTLNSYRKKIEK